MLRVSPAPTVSVLIANYNCAQFLGGAIHSALRQTLKRLEVIVVDDASTDGSRDVARDFAARDHRVRLIELPTNAGPSAARNAGLAAAEGTWVAILDSDDFMHPERLQRLVEEAQAGADICADDLLVFGEGRRPGEHLSKAQRQMAYISLAYFLNSNLIYGTVPATGYLKPLLNLAFLRKHALTYDTALKIGEDADLIARALAAGAKYRLIDSLGYFYRKHPNSISHRLSRDDLQQMLNGDMRLKASLSACPVEVAEAFSRRQASIERALNFDRLVTAIKSRSWSQALQIAIHHPNTISALGMPLAARLQSLRRIHVSKGQSEPTKKACLISRQRIIGPTNGSSAYILGICRALRDDGYDVTLVSPNAGTIGRLPVFRLRPEMSVFNQIFLRGVWKFGNICVSKDPRIALAAVKAKIARALRRFGLERLSYWDTPAPYVIGAPWQRDELLYVAQHASKSELVIADYAFTTPAIPFALSETARSLVVMHDLLSVRESRFKDAKLPDSVKTLDEASEMQLLGQADAIIAIQDIEAKHVKARLPDHTVLLSPVVCASIDAPQPGAGKSVLFIGSNTAPNVIGLRWFLEFCWPQIRAENPDAELIVAGGVSSQFPDGVPRAKFCGIVDDLAPFYREPSVVISPLTVGSGLKVKVVEALAQGKAIVATTVSVEGMGDDIASALNVCDDPVAFGNAVSALLSDNELRRRSADAAYTYFKQHYSREACVRELLAYVNGRSDVSASTVCSLAPYARRGTSIAVDCVR